MYVHVAKTKALISFAVTALFPHMQKSGFLMMGLISCFLSRIKLHEKDLSAKIVIYWFFLPYSWNIL